MTKVFVTTVIRERVITTEVDREELAKRLRFAEVVSKYEGARPGEPRDITATPSDPISREKFHTLDLMLESLKAKDLS